MYGMYYYFNIASPILSMPDNNIITHESNLGQLINAAYITIIIGIYYMIHE